ncbi:dihydrofolate reductase-like domain-containing protein [Myxozyma melibiosi]|uniref:2,5-diamino-6-ribosylamino-4(3H)-pyrimidinone 5'-phosphate reductase n=1 Tax=Myxozyma melibiosi TaxID=54550 RepID=A0ABR1F9X2_9ASCO
MSLPPLPPSACAFLDPYLPSNTSSSELFITLTYAASLDSRISLGPGIRTALSGPESKTMTHYLRAHHDAILVGAGTFAADDPGLNCRYPPASLSGADRSQSALDCSPLPLILDQSFRTNISLESKVLQNATQGIGKFPVVLVSTSRYAECADKIQALEKLGVRVVPIRGLTSLTPRGESWELIRRTFVDDLRIKSVMIEGGAQVINDLLAASTSGTSSEALVKTVIVTIAPVLLGEKGVQVSPAQAMDELSNVRWEPFGRDVVMAASFGSSS